MLHPSSGAHVGTNLSEYNMSMDVGASAAGVKQFNLNDRNFRLVGFGTNILRKNAIDFQDDNLDLAQMILSEVWKETLNILLFQKEKHIILLV